MGRFTFFVVTMLAAATFSSAAPQGDKPADGATTDPFPAEQALGAAASEEDNPTEPGASEIQDVQEEDTDIMGRAIDPCFMPKESGKCKGKLNRFYFNKVTQKCENFRYGGCGGNANRFEDLGACKTNCEDNAMKHLILITTTPPPPTTTTPPPTTTTTTPPPTTTTTTLPPTTTTTTPPPTPTTTKRPKTTTEPTSPPHTTTTHKPKSTPHSTTTQKPTITHPTTHQPSTTHPKTRKPTTHPHSSTTHKPTSRPNATSTHKPTSHPVTTSTHKTTPHPVTTSTHKTTPHPLTTTTHKPSLSHATTTIKPEAKAERSTTTPPPAVATTRTTTVKPNEEEPQPENDSSHVMMDVIEQDSNEDDRAAEEIAEPHSEVEERDLNAEKAVISDLVSYGSPEFL